MRLGLYICSNPSTKEAGLELCTPASRMGAHVLFLKSRFLVKLSHRGRVRPAGNIFINTYIYLSYIKLREEPRNFFRPSNQELPYSYHTRPCFILCGSGSDKITLQASRLVVCEMFS